MRLLLISIIVTFVFNLNYAQNYKFEHEKSVSYKKVPDLALETTKFICGQNKKGKWIKENSIDHISFEFKAKINGQKISIEFDSSGNFEDLELDFILEKLSSVVQGIITKHLRKYDAYRIKSLQLQWTSYEMALSYATLADYSNIEIVIKANKGKHFGNFELLFDKEGNFVRESEIVDKINSDHLDY